MVENKAQNARAWGHGVWGHAELVRHACRKIHSPSHSQRSLWEGCPAVCYRSGTGLGSEQRHLWPLQRVSSWGPGGSTLVGEPPLESGVGGQLLGQEGSSSRATAMKGAQVIYRELSCKYQAPQPTAPMGQGAGEEKEEK